MIRLSAILGLVAAFVPLTIPLAHAQDENPFAALALGAAGASYTVTYQVTGTAEGQTLSGAQTWFMKPPESRFDMSLGGEGDVSMYMLTSGSYMCTRAGGVNCLKMPAVQLSKQNPAANVQGQVQGAPSDYSVTPTGTRVIAGQEALCFVVAGSGGSAGFTEATICYGAGVPLYLAARGDGFEVVQEATSYSTSVSASDLQLPAAPLDLPSIPGIPSGGAPNLPGGLPGGLPSGIPGFPGP